MYRTGDKRIDTLLNELKSHWNGNESFDEAASVTFSFVTKKTDYNATFGIDGGNEVADFQAFSAARKVAARAMLQ